MLSMRLETLTVLPQMSYWGLRAPITPATTGPMLRPGGGGQRVVCAPPPPPWGLGEVGGAKGQRGERGVQRGVQYRKVVWAMGKCEG